MTLRLTREQLYASLHDSGSGLSLRDYLESSSCDVIVDVNLKKNSYKRVYHAENKYYLPPGDYAFSDLANYMVEHIVHPSDKQRLAQALDPKTLNTLLKKSPIPGFVFDDFRFRDRHGHYRYVEQCVLYGEEYGLPKGIARFYGLDVHSLKLREAGLDKDAAYASESIDGVTGLIKDRDFLLSAAKVMVASSSTKWCMAAVDIEHFRLFDEWFGHAKGDELLRSIGSLLNEFCAQVGGIAGYFMQDDFALLIPFDMSLIRRLYDALRECINSSGAPVGFLPAIGVCQLWDKRDLADALDKATVVAEDAKEDIQNRCRVYDASIFRREERDRQLLGEFMNALKLGQITFFLQPQCRISTRKIVGAEALARWKKKDGTFVSPAEFIPVLEKYGFISMLDQYLWDKVCAWQSAWIASGHAAVPVSVNVSRADILTMDIPATFSSLIEKYHLEPKMIKIEITESSYTECMDLVKDLVDHLHKMGFLVLMDDFGSGYSSLNMLSSINVDAVKLDAAFLRFDGLSEERGILILESIVSMTKDIGLPTITEGVETQEQTNFLEDLGCRYVQGYHFYRPMPIADFESLIKKGDNIDSRGFVAKANEQFRVREFLDRNLYSDSMLNNILGPVGFYYEEDGVVDITRFNQQFYTAVNVPDFAERLVNINRFMPEDDVPKMLALLSEASNNRLSGSEGVLRFYRTNGTLTSFIMRFYFLGAKGKGKRYYGAVRDITPLTDAVKKLELLSDVMPRTVVFCFHREGELVYDVQANGLSDVLGVDKIALAKEFATQTFSKHHIAERGLRKQACDQIRDAIHNHKDLRLELPLKTPKGEVVPCVMEIRYVGEKADNVAFMLLLDRK